MLNETVNLDDAESTDRFNEALWALRIEDTRVFVAVLLTGNWQYGDTIRLPVGPGRGPRPTPEIIAELKTKIARVRNLEEGHAEPLDPNWQDHVGIEEIDATVGAGSTGTDGAVKTRLKFPYPWLRKHGLRAHLCRIVRMAGEAMEPTIPDGGLILINTEGAEHRDGKVYVLHIGEDVLVRRLIHDPEAGWLLPSDNPDKAAWPTQPWPENAITNGEVKWLGRTFM